VYFKVNYYIYVTVENPTSIDNKYLSFGSRLKMKIRNSAASILYGG